MQAYPFIFSNQFKYRFARHLSFWIFWWIFQAIIYAPLQMSQGADMWSTMAISLMESFIFIFNHIFLAYTLMYWVIPHFLLKQNYTATVVWTAVLCVGSAAMAYVLATYISNPLRGYLAGYACFTGYFKHQPVILVRSLMGGLRGGLTIGGFAAAIKLMKYWYIKEQRNLQLQKENMAAQLQLLKAQVHPHFLFNTLNNIYSNTQLLAPAAADMIAGLSNILRFILYESNQPLVPLTRELQLLGDYMELERVRYGNKLDLHIDLPTNTDKLYIAPLLLLPLVENCFKHGTSQMLDQPWITFHATLHQKQLHIKLTNGKVPHSTGTRGGIGIQNVRKRLELLYPGKHEFVITDEEDVFIVTLKLELERLVKSPAKPLPVTEFAYA